VLDISFKLNAYSTVRFRVLTGNARLTELLYVIADGWPGIMSPDEFQCLVLS